MKHNPLMDGAAYLMSAAQEGRAETTLADHIIRIDREFTPVLTLGRFLNFRDYRLNDNPCTVGTVDSLAMTGDAGAVPAVSYMADIPAAAFEAVAARMWRGMVARAAMRASERETALAGYAATMPEREARLAACAAYRDVWAGLTAETWQVAT